MAAALPGELLEEILLRLPPDEPACFLRASLVCKTWGGAMSRPGFRRRLHELHGAAPMLGFLQNFANARIPRFIPTIAPSFSLAVPDHRSWRTLDCRHGRALFISSSWQRVRKVCDEQGFPGLFPVVSFYTPHSRLEALRGEHHYPPPPPSHIEGGGREEKETVEQTQELFDKCKVMEKGNFANSIDCFNNHTFQTRVPHQAELPLDDPSENVSKNVPNEESVEATATTSKDDPGTSEASGGLHAW